MINFIILTICETPAISRLLNLVLFARYHTNRMIAVRILRVIVYTPVWVCNEFWHSTHIYTEKRIFSIKFLILICARWIGTITQNHLIFVEAMLKAFFHLLQHKILRWVKSIPKKSPTKHYDYAYARMKTSYTQLHTLISYPLLVNFNLCRFCCCWASEYPVTDSFPLVSCCSHIMQSTNFNIVGCFCCVCVICECRNDCVLARAPIIMNVKNKTSHIPVKNLRFLFILTNIFRIRIM